MSFFQIKQKNDENNDLLQEINKERTTKRVIAKQFSHPKKKRPRVKRFFFSLEKYQY